VGTPANWNDACDCVAVTLAEISTWLAESIFVIVAPVGMPGPEIVQPTKKIGSTLVDRPLIIFEPLAVSPTTEYVTLPQGCGGKEAIGDQTFVTGSQICPVAPSFPLFP
jgi:hypothetical protein